MPTNKSIRQNKKHLDKTNSTVSQRVKRNKKYNYRQTTFKPKNTKKYCGSYPIKLRSSWEIAFAHKCDLDPNIIKWGSESFIVPYLDATKNNSKHLYYTDFNITAKTKTGIKRFIIEIKPKKQTIAPESNRFKTTAKFKSACETYVRNQCKWNAARLAAKKHGMEFIIVTEENLNIKHT